MMFCLAEAIKHGALGGRLTSPFGLPMDISIASGNQRSLSVLGQNRIEPIERSLKVMLSKVTPGYARFPRQIVYAVLLSLFASPSFAQRPAAGPFAALLGSWSGTGIIALSNGTKERIRCRANYRLGNTSESLQLELNCASDSYKFELQSSIGYTNGSISGTWFESTRKANGAITGHIAGSQINARAEGQTFTALLVLNTRGDRQSISIQSPGSEMSEVTIGLTRGSR